MRKFTIIFWIAICFFAINFNLYGAAKTWTGNSSNNWNTAGNWSPSGVPGSGDDVTININAAIQVDNNNCIIKSLTISGSVAVSFISSVSGSKITIANNGSSIDIGSTLTLQGSTGSGTRSMTIAFSGTSRTMSIAGTLILTAVGEGTIYNATNSLTTVTGTIKNDATGSATTGVITSTASNLTFSDGGTYQHNINGGTIPTATWNATSTCLITGITGTDPSGDGQAFGNLTYDCIGMTSDRSMASSGLSIAGNFNVTNTGTFKLLQNQTPLVVTGNCTINDNFRISTGSTARLLDVRGNFTCSGGTLTMSDGSATGSLNVYGNFVMSGGTITETSTGSGTGTINFCQIGSQSYSKTGGTFANTINFVVSNSSTLDMGTSVIDGSIGTFTLNSTSGIITAHPQGLSTTAGTGSIQVTGTKTYTTTASYTYDGTGAQVTGNGLPSTVNNLMINNSAGVSLTAAVIVSGTLNMTLGDITTGANILALGTSTSSRGTLNYNSGAIITGSTGGFKRWFTTATVSNVYFPVGTSYTINMVTLSFTGAPTAGGSLTAKFISSDPGIINPFLDDAGYSVESYSQKGYWQIDAGNGLTGGTYNLSLRGQGFNPLGGAISVINYPKLRILKSTNSGSNWIVNGTHLDATGSNLDPTIQRTGLSGFSQFAMGGNVADGNPLDGPMPVELSSFTANVISRDIKLNWTTATEENNAGFEIQKSTQNNNWIKVGYITGNGTKTTPTSYTFEDKKLNTGKYNYRLKQIDYNGNFEYFNLTGEIEIGVPNKFDISQNYPNPFNPTTKIDFDLPYASRVSMKLYDISGREVMTLMNETKAAGYYTVQMNGNNLSSGMYFYRIIAEGNGQNFVSVKKLVLIK